MKKILTITMLILALCAALLYLFREPVKEWAYARITQDMFVEADVDTFDPGPAVGSRFPGVRALYNGREIALIDRFSGENGTILVASRSLDWCPYCMRQLIQLQEHKTAFDDAGIGVVAITYDTPAQQKAFADKFGITVPLLSDINALTFKTLGILNEKYQPGDMQYGIAHPGMIVIDPDGNIAGKLFLEAYSSRVDSAAALHAATEMLNLQR